MPLECASTSCDESFYQPTFGIQKGRQYMSKLIKNGVDDFTVIAIEFDKFSDGKSYSTASQLRGRYGYKGELRAIGDVPGDRLNYRYQVGFDAFVVSDHKNANRNAGTVLSGWFGSAIQPGELAAVAG